MSMPRKDIIGLPLAWCEGCGKEVPLEDHYAYDGKAWHGRCLRRWLQHQIRALRFRKDKPPELMELELEYEEALRALEGKVEEEEHGRGEEEI
jgi:hypothetical protein